MDSYLNRAGQGRHFCDNSPMAHWHNKLKEFVAILNVNFFAWRVRKSTLNERNSTGQHFKKG